MFLKSIEIRGFKSFADKTELSFINGVTAVVGPNGSGKSNISDAVRWVLGEQSIKSLRGGKMEDVIFAGTQYRKPVGLAQVALTLDNSDYALPIEYSDVTISRRLYRSGESEYYINNTHCRLKDIHELFMDTGIGKEGYSIIGQGKIDAILSGRPEERRNLLEEAAGIVKFKTRKDEAEKKLDSTEQNLIRINDILSTYEDRLEPLRVESEKAKVFIQLSEELKTKEVTLILASIDRIQNRLDEQKNYLVKLQEEIYQLTSERNNAKDELKKWTEALEDHDRHNNDDKTRYYELKNKHQNAISENNLQTERINNLLVYINKTSNELKDLQAQIQKLQDDKGLMEEELKSQQTEQRAVDISILNLEKSIEKLNKSTAVEAAKASSLREEEIELLRKLSEVKNNTAVIQNNMDSSQKKLEQINTACESYTNSMQINKSTKTALECEIVRIKDEITGSEEQIKGIKKEISQMNSKLHSDEINLKQLTGEANKLDANYSMLMNLEKQYEGYNKAVKNLMQNIGNGRIPQADNNCFVLGDVISVDSNHELAIETALGGAISDIITYDETTAKLLIKYLKDNNLGRATFLPLNILKSKKLVIDQKMKDIDGFIGIASDLISYDSIFTKAVDYVLGRTVIASNLDSALSIAKYSSYSHKIVTLTGEVINPGGSLTGGSSYHKSTSIIGRKREIDEIKYRSEAVKADIASLLRSIEHAKGLVKELDSKGLNIRDEIHYKHIEITKIEGKIAAILSETEKLKLSLSTSKEEIAMIEYKIEAYRLELMDKEKQIVELNQREERNQKLIEEAENLVSIYEKELKEVKESFLENKIKKAHIDEIVLGKIKELERFERDLGYALQKSEEYTLEIKDSTQNLEASRAMIEENSRNVDAIVQSIEEIEKKFEINEVLRIELKDKIKNTTGRYDELSMILEKRESEKHRHELSLAKQEMEKEAFFTRLNDEIGLTYAEAVKFKVEMPDAEKFKREIGSLKGRITALGVVNLGAIEEYKQIKEKYSFMSTQREDLIKAKTELLNVINEMTSKMKEVFNENFQKLKENFNETFRELFKGGSADLILSEGDELTANIDINVQPPGKKLQNINLMSGGEKGLSAIALLFAILKMKPTPFCILDEIEAALDDANVFRYAEFLKKFSEGIQFIVITHRKGTMEACDVLYGVTMEEKGVSKIVSVNLGK
jgi:chromosome segregation protein